MGSSSGSQVLVEVETVADGYRIGEVAAATGFPASTLRYYEDEGLLPAPDRTPSGQRVYRDDHVARLRWARHRIDEGGADGLDRASPRSGGSRIS